MPKPRTMSQKKHKSPPKGKNKTWASKRTANPPQPHGEQPLNTTATFQSHDAKGRMGGFEGAGEHARTGNRGHQ